MIGIHNPYDILCFMDNIKYGYIDLLGKKHINNLKGFRTNYKTLSIDQILENRIGTCIEQVLLMHKLLNDLNVPNKMFCTRIYESGSMDPEAEEHMHCFILYADKTGTHQIEHPDAERKGIYDFKDEAEAVQSISGIYQSMSGGIERIVTEYFEVKPGLSFKKFNDYINGLDSYKK